jgi:hypothetical protein
MKKILFLIVLVFCSCFLLAEIIYVPDDYSTIQEAIVASSAGDEIIVRDDNEPYVEDLMIGVGKYITLRSEYNNPAGCTIMPLSDPNAVLVVNAHEDGTVTIKGFTFAYNGTSQNTNGLYIGYLVNISDCLIRDMGASGIHIGSCEYNDINVTNCTIVSNSNYGIYCSQLAGDQLTVLNTIVYDNYSGQIQWDNNSVSYSCIQGGYTGTGNIDEDPLFEDPENGNYSLQWNEQHISPCIDSGDPTIIDPDETPSDMGAYRAVYHDFHLTTAQLNRYRYRSFPVIDREYVQHGFETTYICEPVEEQTQYFKIFYIDGRFQEWDGEDWNSNEPLVTLDSVEGYKLKTISDVEIPTSGRTLPENTRVYLDEGNNWVGYFIRESMGISEAFAEILDHITAIYSEDWAWDSSHIPHPRNTLIYGKMYIVRVDEACDFVYGEGNPVPNKEREMTEGFYYVETPEYSPINIESLDDPTVLEVGVFLDEECIGATQVEEFPLQILAFPPEGSSGSGEVTFEFYCGLRSYKPAHDYKVLNKETGQYVNSKIELRPYEFTTICFGNPPTPVKFTLSGNYPNPFNPSTTINYSIPLDSNIELIIYNIKGQKVKTLVKGTQPTGVYTVTWNGKDESSKDVTSGIYFYKLRTQQNELTRKMLLLK